MIKPFEIIEAQKKVIDDFKYKLQFSNDKVKDASVINTLVDTVNSFESMLISKYYTDALELFIYSLIYEWFLQFDIANKEIPLDLMVWNIDKDIREGLKSKKESVILLLKTHELGNLDKYEIENHEYADFRGMLDKLINKFKTQIKWSKK